MRTFAMVAGAMMAGLGGALLLPSPVAAASVEQLLAAGIGLADLRAAGFAGEWSSSLPYVGAEGVGPGIGRAKALVIADLFSWDAPRHDLEGTIGEYADAETAAAAMAEMAEEDVGTLGAMIAEGGVGEQARLHRLDGEGKSASLRWQAGRFLARITAAHPAAETDIPALYRLADQVTARLEALDRGELHAAPLPPLAESLPSGDAAVSVLGTVAGMPEWWAWESKEGKDVTSPRLRDLLKEGVADGRPVGRQYLVPGVPGHYATVTVMPFVTADAAARYVAAGVPAGVATAPGRFDVRAPRPAENIRPWRADVASGRFVIEVDCRSDVGDVSPACEGVARRLAERTLANLR
ncbi:MAG: hypothetical protein ACM33T_05090 [Solirubrobacterales bacterium]